MYLRINPLHPTSHVMHHQFNIQQLYALPTLYLCVLYLSQNKCDYNIWCVPCTVVVLTCFIHVVCGCVGFVTFVFAVCVLAFTVFCIVCTVFLYYFVYVYLFLFVLSVLV
jgi:hypothetical protein